MTTVCRRPTISTDGSQRRPTISAADGTQRRPTISADITQRRPTIAADGTQRRATINARDAATTPRAVGISNRNLPTWLTSPRPANAPAAAEAERDANTNRWRGAFTKVGAVNRFANAGSSVHASRKSSRQQGESSNPASD